MRHYVPQWNPFLLHQCRRQLRGALNRSSPAAPTVLAHFDADRVFVTRPSEVRMYALFADRHVLNGNLVIHRVVPDEIARTLVRPKGTTLQRHRVALRIRGIVLSTMDGDVAGIHRHREPPAVAALPDHILTHVRRAHHPRNGCPTGDSSRS